MGKVDLINMLKPTDHAVDEKHHLFTRVININWVGELRISWTLVCLSCFGGLGGLLFG